MKYLLSFLLTFSFLSNTAFSDEIDDLISKVDKITESEHKSNLKTTLGSLRHDSAILKKLTDDLKTAKTKRLWKSGIAIPVTMITSYFLIKNLGSSSGSTGIGGNIANGVTLITNALLGVVTVGGVAVVYLSFSDVAEIQENIDIVQRDLAMEYKLYKRQYEK